MTAADGRSDGEYVTPPLTFVDDEDRTIEIREGSEDDIDALVDLYVDFHHDDRSQGLPPRTEEKIRDWLSYVYPENSQHVVAWDGDRAIGHAFLVPAGDGRHELAIFVLREYQAAHIGTELMYTLLGYGREEGITQVWLSVEAWNNHAITLYENFGFEKHNVARTEVEMALQLDRDEGVPQEDS